MLWLSKSVGLSVALTVMSLSKLARGSTMHKILSRKFQLRTLLFGRETFPTPFKFYRVPTSTHLRRESLKTDYF